MSAGVGDYMIRKLVMALSMIVLGMMAFAIPSEAQRGGSLTGRGGPMGVRPHVPFQGAPHGGYLTGPRYHRLNRGHRSNAYPYLYPYYYPDYYSNYYPEQAPTEAQPTRVVVVQNPQPRAEVPPQPPPESLMLELQGNHWVRVTSSGRTESASQSPKQGAAQVSTGSRTITPQQSVALETAGKLPPAVLVFRDGHKEEIARYAIVGGTIYANTEYWNKGSWTRKVPIAELNVPATLQLNQDRGTRFSLPSGPGEIVVRP